jgi:hypothetical protein
MLAQAMHHQHDGARRRRILAHFVRPGIQRPLVQGQVFAVAGGEGR